MRPVNRSVLTGLAGLLAATSCLVGCDTTGLVTQFPALSPYLGPRPKSPPFALGRGHIAGKVVRANNIPVGNAFITNGGAFAYSAQFPENEDEIELVEDADNGRDKVFVEHEFEDGSIEPALRIVRKFPSGNTRAGKYYYLRAGEFLLEGLPEGEVLVTAQFGEVRTPPTRLTVFPSFLLTGLEFRLAIPEPLAKVNNADPPVLEWIGLEPTSGITLKIVTRTVSTGGDTNTETTVNYAPDPPDVRVSLVAPPGSGGGTVYYYRIFYTYSTPASRRVSKDDVATPDVVYPTPPITVPPGQQQNYGPSVEFTIPLGSTAIQKLFAKDNEDELPILVMARIQFLDQAKQPFLDASGREVEVAVPMRSLTQ
ncbi:MAG: hypothetical protein VKQ33_11860 [Candidatus Sericytochromatia bacterium]|nr:hypothetical protein [Candidatus Sericytochromatia bacterium]